MGNIYEALEHAGCRNANLRVAPGVSLPTAVIRDVSLRSEMAWLHNQVQAVLSVNDTRIVQFVASRRGEGVSTIIREFAKVAVERHGKTVLVLDASYQDPARTVNINGSRDDWWVNLVEEGKLIDKAFFKAEGSNLYFAPIPLQSSLNRTVTEVPLDLWEMLKDRFDLILIDSSSDQAMVDSLALVRNADGVIMVVEAEKTKKIAAARLKKRILDSGGCIIGVILNKRMYHIPSCIYKMLFE